VKLSCFSLLDVPVFIQEEFDFESLKNITEKGNSSFCSPLSLLSLFSRFLDLADMGVKIGSRRKLLTALHPVVKGMKERDQEKQKEKLTERNRERGRGRGRGRQRETETRRGEQGRPRETYGEKQAERQKGRETETEPEVEKDEAKHSSHSLPRWTISDPDAELGDKLLGTRAALRGGRGFLRGCL
jgi:hypothetical protein